MHLFFSRRSVVGVFCGPLRRAREIRRPKTRSVEAESDFKAGNVLPGRKAAAERFVFRNASRMEIYPKCRTKMMNYIEIWMKYMVILSIHVRFQGSTFCAPRKQYMRNIFITCVCCFIPSRQNQLTTKTTRRRIQS